VVSGLINLWINLLLIVQKDLFSKSKSFIKEQQDISREKRYSHLYAPTNDKPLEIKDAIFYGDYFTFYSKKYDYSDIISIKYYASSSSYNLVMTETENEFKIFLQLENGQNFPLKNRETNKVINISASSWFVFGSSKKLREKMNFFSKYLQKITFENRLLYYINGHI